MQDIGFERLTIEIERKAVNDLKYYLRKLILHPSKRRYDYMETMFQICTIEDYIRSDAWGVYKRLGDIDTQLVIDKCKEQCGWEKIHEGLLNDFRKRLFK